MFNEPKNHIHMPKIMTSGDLAEFLGTLSHRESFVLDLVDTYPRPGWNRAGNIVWFEGSVRSDQTEFQFFFDDGVEPEFDEHGDAVGETNDFPSILCSVSDIVAVKKI